MLRNRERIGSSLAAKGFVFPKCVLPRVCIDTIPQESDGALLCNFESTMFKKNLQGLAAFKTFNYASTEVSSKIGNYSLRWNRLEANNNTAG